MSELALYDILPNSMSGLNGNMLSLNKFEMLKIVVNLGQRLSTWSDGGSWSQTSWEPLI